MKRAAIALTALLALHTQAAYMNGNMLLERINNRSDVPNYTSGLGYIMGVVDAHDGEEFCVPAEVTAAQLRDLTLTALVNVPAQRHMPADIYVRAAVSRAFPCTKSAPPAKNSKKDV